MGSFCSIKYQVSESITSGPLRYHYWGDGVWMISSFVPAKWMTPFCILTKFECPTIKVKKINIFKTHNIGFLLLYVFCIKKHIQKH